MHRTADVKWTVEPFRLGTAEEFARVRELFVRLGFEETPLCARFGVDSIRELLLADERGTYRTETGNDAPSLLLKLFVRGEQVAWSVLRSAMSPADLVTLEALELLHPVKDRPELCVATIGIDPIGELFVAADRLDGYDSTDSEPPRDLVYSPITSQTTRFLQLMPREPRESVLDLGTGSGILALVAASDFAGRVTAVDIAERSVRFAAFNAALNNLGMVRALQGDLYEPVAGEDFDLIVAHPPYVPAAQTEFVFRDAGEDGEQISQRIIAGLPDHLRPGGHFFCSCMMTDRRGAPLEDRVRGMLGAAAGDFDVIIGQEKTLEPLQFFARQLRQGLASSDSMSRWQETVDRLEIEQLVIASLLFQRRENDRPVVTTRRALSPVTSAADLQWVARWLVATAHWGPEESRRLLSSRPRTLPRTELRSRSILRDGQWSVEECMLVTLAPFAIEASCPNWYATLLQFCDGRMTAREHLQYLRDTHAVPDGASEEAFGMMIRQLVDAGLVEIDEFRLPDSTAMRDTAGARERTTESRPVERAD
jgi:SAM-dependent methyltransferase